MTRFFGGAEPNSKLATKDANALVAHYGGHLAYQEARRRCRDVKFTLQRQAGHWERVSNILAVRTGRPSRSLIFNLEIPQNYTRHVGVGEPVEITVKTHPGEVYTGRVEAVLGAIETRPAQLDDAPDVQSGPFMVRIKLDDQDVAEPLPLGSTGLSVIFTDHVKTSHLSRRVVLRQTAVLNYAE